MGKQAIIHHELPNPTLDTQVQSHSSIHSGSELVRKKLVTADDELPQDNCDLICPLPVTVLANSKHRVYGPFSHFLGATPNWPLVFRHSEQRQPAASHVALKGTAKSHEHLGDSKTPCSWVFNLTNLNYLEYGHFHHLFILPDPLQ